MAEFSSEIDYKLFFTGEDYTVLQVHLLFSALPSLQVKVSRSYDATGVELKQLTEAPTSIALQTPAGLITQRLTVLKQLSLLADGSFLGSSPDEQAQSDQWLEVSWKQLGKWF